MFRQSQYELRQREPGKSVDSLSNSGQGGDWVLDSPRHLYSPAKCKGKDYSGGHE